MNNYKPPYTLTSKILTPATQITEELTKLEYNAEHINTPKLCKKTESRLWQGR